MEINKKINKDVYSSTEVKTNKTWIDGKPIYRNLIQKTVSASNTGSKKTVVHNISNVDTAWIIKDYSYVIWNNRKTCVGCMSSDTRNLVDFNIDSTNLSYYVGSYITAYDTNPNMTLYAYVEYTKTTD